MHKIALMIALASTAVAGGYAQAAEPDWSKVKAKDITVFYPGVSPMEWITKGTEHGGARALRKGETCLGCHEEEAADMGAKIVSGQAIEPAPIKGKAASIPVKLQAAHDGSNLYLRFSWKQPAASGAAKMDAANQVKLTLMLDDGKVETANLAGCWASCHGDARTMPGADAKKTKYVKNGNLASGVYYDLLQWASKDGASDGHVATERVMKAGKGLVSASGKLANGSWTVTFVRKLAGGGTGDIALAAGKTYNFGFAIHDDHANGRYHHVSLGYTLGIGAAADITAGKM